MPDAADLVQYRKAAAADLRFHHHHSVTKLLLPLSQRYLNRMSTTHNLFPVLHEAAHGNMGHIEISRVAAFELATRYDVVLYLDTDYLIAHPARLLGMWRSVGGGGRRPLHEERRARNADEAKRVPEESRPPNVRTRTAVPKHCESESNQQSSSGGSGQRPPDWSSCSVWFLPSSANQLQTSAMTVSRLSLPAKAKVIRAVLETDLHIVRRVDAAKAEAELLSVLSAGDAAGAPPPKAEALTEEGGAPPPSSEGRAPPPSPSEDEEYWPDNWRTPDVLLAQVELDGRALEAAAVEDLLKGMTFPGGRSVRRPEEGPHEDSSSLAKTAGKMMDLVQRVRARTIPIADSPLRAMEITDVPIANLSEPFREIVEQKWPARPGSKGGPQLAGGRLPPLSETGGAAEDITSSAEWTVWQDSSASRSAWLNSPSARPLDSPFPSLEEKLLNKKNPQAPQTYEVLFDGRRGHSPVDLLSAQEHVQGQALTSEESARQKRLPTPGPYKAWFSYVVSGDRHVL